MVSQTLSQIRTHSTQRSRFVSNRKTAHLTGWVQALRSRTVVVVAMFVIGLQCVNASNADTIGVDLVGDNFISYQNLSGLTMGYQFTLEESATVTGLGFWTGSGMFDDTQVGLWDTNATLMGTVNIANYLSVTNDGSVTMTPTKSGKWVFKDVSLSLGPGSYVVAAQSDLMEYIIDETPTHPSSIVTSVITFDMSRYAAGPLQFPASTSSIPSAGFFGGNVRFASEAVPTPSSFAALIGMGLMGLVAVARRERKRALRSIVQLRPSDAHQHAAAAATSRHTCRSSSGSRRSTAAMMAAQACCTFGSVTSMGCCLVSIPVNHQTGSRLAGQETTRADGRLAELRSFPTLRRTRTKHRSAARSFRCCY